MEDLLFSLNATLPIFLMMMLGYALRHVGLVSEQLASLANGFVFKVCLPVALFGDLWAMDFADAWDGGFVGFCAAVTLGNIAICALASRAFGQVAWRGEFVQSSYRSGAAFLGVAFVQSIYGDAGIAPLMVLGAVPIYNASAVIILQVMRPGEGHVDAALVRSVARGIVTNPIILGIVGGCTWSVLRLPTPQILGRVVTDVGGIATPLGLIALGATFSFRKAFGMRLPTMVSCFIKLVGLAAIFLPIAVVVGFTGQRLAAILLMLTLPSTVSGYVMAKSMGYEGTVASSVVMLSTLLSAVTITLWLWLVKAQGLV